MDKDIKAIVLLLATQAMINLGEITDPITGESKYDLQGATTFIQLLDILELKTRGNLAPEEEEFLADVRDNLDKVYNKKFSAVPGN